MESGRQLVLTLVSAWTRRVLAEEPKTVLSGYFDHSLLALLDAPKDNSR